MLPKTRRVHAVETAGQKGSVKRSSTDIETKVTHIDIGPCVGMCP